MSHCREITNTKSSLIKKKDTLHVDIFIISSVIFKLRRHTIPQINPLNILFSPFLITFGARNGSF